MGEGPGSYGMRMVVFSHLVLFLMELGKTEILSPFGMLVRCGEGQGKISIIGQS